MNLYASAAFVALARGLGMLAAVVFTIVVADRFGSDRATDVAFTALIVPQALMVMMGNFFPPVFVSMFKTIEINRGSGEAWAFGRSAVTALTLAGVVATAAGVAASPLLAEAVSGSFSAEDVARVSRYMRYAFVLVGLTATASVLKGLLNAEGSFFVPGLDTLVMNVAAVAVVLAMTPAWGEFALVAGIVTGAAAKIVLMAPGYLRRAWRASGPFFHPALRDVSNLLGPVILNSLLFALNAAVLRKLAGSIGPGAVSHLTYAERVFSAPQDLFFVSLGVVLLPSLAGHATSGDFPALRRLVTVGLRISVFLGVPAAVGVALLAEPITALIYQHPHGRFDARDTVETARALRGYAAALAFSGISILTQVFYALRQTKAILVTGAVVLVVNASFGALLVGRFGQAGLAFSCSLAAAAGYAASLVLLARRAGWPDLRAVALCGARTAVCASVMGAAVWVLPSVHVLARVAAGVAVFLLLARFLCPAEWRYMRKLWPRAGP